MTGVNLLDSLAICIPTYKRPEYLSDLLQSLTNVDMMNLTAHVILVDNDPLESARDVANDFLELLPNLIYEVEPVRGIAASRNRLVAITARLNCDYLVFVDDDERVDPAWLRSLMECAYKYDADAVAGVVLPDYETEIPEWMKRDHLFNEQPRSPSGTKVKHLGMGNTLVKSECLAQIDGPFDVSLSLTGGEDTLLWSMLHWRGIKMVWCDEAIVYERIPPSRATVSWLVKRHYNYGIYGSRNVLRVAPSRTGVILRLLRSSARLAQGIVLLPIAMLRGRASSVRALQIAARGLGGIVGLFGVQYEEYRKTHGR
jgi:succinoglycan biosynthesis protein ExoM